MGSQTPEIEEQSEYSMHVTITGAVKPKGDEPANLEMKAGGSTGLQIPSHYQDSIYSLHYNLIRVTIINTAHVTS